MSGPAAGSGHAGLGNGTAAGEAAGHGAGHGAGESDGTALLAALYNAAKSLQLYPADNEVVRRALVDAEARARTVFEREGGLSLWVAGRYMFVNDLRVRLDMSDYATFAALREMLRAHGIGRVDVDPRVTRQDWSRFLELIGSDPATDGEPLEHARKRLAADGGSGRIRIGAHTPIFGNGDSEETLAAARQTYARSVKAARDLMAGAVLGKAIAGRRAERAVLGIVDTVLKDRASILAMLTMREYDDHSFVHAVNVAILSVALGEHLGFEREQLFELGFAGLFHDIGKLLVPNSVLNKQGWLNDEEWRLVSQHPDFGMLMLFNMEGFSRLPYRAMLSVYEHHMKPDLSGYPRVIRRRRQGFFARIVAVVEAYDAAVSSYSKQFLPCPPDEAIRQLRDADSGGFDRVVVKAFVNMMGLYPVGTLVILDSGEMAAVVAPNPNPRALNRPLVRLATQADGSRVGDGAVVDLTELDEEGKPRRSILRSTDPERYNIDMSDLVA